MSKIGKKPIQIPNGIDVKIDGNSVFIKGPKGDFKREVSEYVELKSENGNVVVTPRFSGKPKEDKKSLQRWGLNRALIQNMIKGANEGYEKKLEFEGVGYRANVKGSDLELNLGYSHPILMKAPEGISFKVEKNVITITGPDKELVGQTAADIRLKRKPEPYRGSGIKYQGEAIRRKIGKKAAA